MTSPDLTEHDRAVETLDDLLAPFFEATKPTREFRIGAEAEKFGVDATTFAPLPYEGEHSVVTILGALAERHGWAADRETEHGPLIALRRSGASITLEPGSQLELSGAPFDNVHQICAEFSGHVAELRDISSELGLAWLGVGFHPLAKQSELTFVPKQRYAIMRRYLPTRGKYGLDMMRRTATVQANFDYVSEASAMRALRVSLRLSPVITAMFANSPFYEGAPFGGRSYRARVWTSVDPDRQGLLENVLERGTRFSDYIDWAVDAPMFLVKRGETVIENTGQSFRSFMRHGFDGHRPTMKDWETHLNTLFPEVRLKRTLEVRSADNQAAPLVCALPAVWTGILYDDKALDEADDLTRDYKFAELEALREPILMQALGATFRGAPLAKVAERVIEIANGGLERRARLNKDGKDERVHLAKLAALVEHGHCPADKLLEGIEAHTGEGLRAEIVRRSLL